MATGLGFDSGPQSVLGSASSSSTLRRRQGGVLGSSTVGEVQSGSGDRQVQSGSLGGQSAPAAPLQPPPSGQH